MNLKDVKLDQIKSVIREFEKLQCYLEEYGATKNKPSRVFQEILVSAFTGKDYLGKDYLPYTVIEWGLLDKSGAEEAAKKLTNKVNQVRQLILKTPLSDAAPLGIFMKHYCWRLVWS